MGFWLWLWLWLWLGFWLLAFGFFWILPLWEARPGAKLLLLGSPQAPFAAGRAFH